LQRRADVLVLTEHKHREIVDVEQVGVWDQAGDRDKLNILETCAAAAGHIGRTSSINANFKRARRSKEDRHGCGRQGVERHPAINHATTEA
jgi:hypothetical protein